MVKEDWLPEAVLAAAFSAALSLRRPFFLLTSRASWPRLLAQPLFAKRAADGSQVALLKGHAWGSCQRTVAASDVPGKEAWFEVIFAWVGKL